MSKTPHILNAASNLLGITLIIIAGLNVSGKASGTLADEIAWAAAVLFSLSCILSYLTLRTDDHTEQIEGWADRIFLFGLLSLLAAVLVLALSRI